MKKKLNKTETESWKDPDRLTNAMKIKKIAKKCKRCIYLEQATRGKAHSPECQRNLLLNNEFTCKNYILKDSDEE